MNKNIFIIAVVVLVIIVGGALFFSREQSESQSLDQKEALTLIELTTEEQQALQNEGIEPLPTEEDIETKSLQSVRFSDELDAIEADLIETDLSNLNAELELIEIDLSGF